MANDLAPLKATILADAIVEKLDRINVMMPLVNRKYEGVIGTKGDTVNVVVLSDILVKPYTGSIAWDDLEPTLESMVIDQADYFAFYVDDVDAAQTAFATLDLYAERAARSISDAIENKLVTTGVAGVPTGNVITGTSNAAITLTASNVYEHFVKVRTLMSKNHVPQTGRWAVVNPETVALLLRSTEFVRATDLGDRVVQTGLLGTTAQAAPGFIGRVAGFDVYESTALPVASGATNLLFGDRGFLSYAAQINSIERMRLQDKFATAVRGLLLHGAKVFSAVANRGAAIKVAVPA